MNRLSDKLRLLGNSWGIESGRYHAGPINQSLLSTTIDTAHGVAGFSLHAGVGINMRQRKKLERIRHYITRPAVSTMRRLREARMVTFRDGFVTFMDYDRLSTFADFKLSFLDQTGPLLK